MLVLAFVTAALEPALKPNTPPETFLSILNGSLRLKQPEADDIARIFKELQLPVPTSSAQVRQGYEGIMIFLNDYGVVIKIENDEKASNNLRVNNSSWILKPLATIRTQSCLIEICPGCELFINNSQESSMVTRELKKEGLLFWDEGARNLGYLPIKNVPGFPNGLPVVIDRLAIRFNASSLQGKLDLLLPKFHPQDILHGELMRGFAKAWPKRNAPADAGKMREFWALCKQHLSEGKLVSGWAKFRDHKYEDFSHATNAQYIGNRMAVLGDEYSKLMLEKPKRDVAQRKPSQHHIRKYNALNSVLKEFRR